MSRPQRHCAECGAPFPVRGRKLFCSQAHAIAFNNRQLARGQAVMGVAQAWRAGRHPKSDAERQAAGEAFRQLCRLIDAYNAEDAAAGRAKPMSLYRARVASGLFE